ncbi:hypothetical protein MB831_10605 [Pasteurella multocida subsp. multocida]|uniref:hypothetical protein n=1 Tax=Pasteurella multocida TaxID=747 RepID=UPI000CE8B541|nr:hypothetical protein [Pasteurella multocida]MCW4597919.1 hypothetical protein [Pasteurella multocida subsp. multocida]PPE94542.1 hypothetical protein CBE90_06320 [Pasteurella multocida]PPE95475.1 hypothetical protein CBE91_09305 [Pasteurella multocida]WNY75916.1 hypothetical protein H2513_08500 [Pasteurella multocida]HDR1006678.1 hypothetical protein [Pasteurella multocida]
MQKIILGMLVVTASNAMALNNNFNVYGKVGVDLVSRFDTVDPSIYHFSVPHKRNTFSPSAFLELTYNVLPQTELGGGVGFIKRNSFKHISYGIHNETGADVNATEKYQVPRYRSIPLYATLKQNFSFTPNTMLYLKGDLGYAFNRTKSTTLNVILHDYTGNGQDYIEKTNINMSAKDGAYYGISLGLEYYNFLAEVGYYHTSSRISFASSPQKTVAYKQVSYNNDAIRLSIGYKF